MNHFPQLYIISEYLATSPKH